MNRVSIDQRPDEQADVRRLDPALGAYKRRMRRLGFRYAGVLALVVVAVVAWVAVVMSHSEIAHATLHSASKPAPAIQPAPASSTQHLAWSNGDQLAIGTPFWDGTVVTFSAHTVTGRNAASGVPTWTYTRSDMTICEVAETQGQTMAIFNREGNCDEIDAFDTNKGTRSWSRTLDSDGQTTNGIPTFAISQYTLLLTTPSQVQAIVPSGGSEGLDRWNTSAPKGCVDVQSVLGSNGVLIKQKCGDGDYLQMRDAYASDKINSQPNPKLQLWRIKVDADVVPVSSDTVTSAYDPSSGALLVYGDTGQLAKQLTLDVRPAGTLTPVASPQDSDEVIWLGGQTYQLDTRTSALDWTLPLTGPPTIDPSQLVAASAAGIVAIDGQRGAITTTYALSPAASGSAVYPVGSGFLVGRSSAGGHGTAVYR